VARICPKCKHDVEIVDVVKILSDDEIRFLYKCTNPNCRQKVKLNKIKAPIYYPTHFVCTGKGNLRLAQPSWLDYLSDTP